ncbi:hypothetical protein C8J57DRAFT_1733078 [Mycena rebaudengoi]|nr:hypothetical protein C8J57DRAFT_1733078 [Mycena rebaudengoi]
MHLFTSFICCWYTCLRLLPIMLLVRVRGHPADVGHERRDDAPARARPRKPPTHPIVLVFRPIHALPPHPHPACLAHRRQPRVPAPNAPIMGSVTSPTIRPGSQFLSNSASCVCLVKNDDDARDRPRLAIFASALRKRSRQTTASSSSGDESSSTNEGLSSGDNRYSPEAPAPKCRQRQKRAHVQSLPHDGEESDDQLLKATPACHPRELPVMIGHDVHSEPLEIPNRHEAMPHIYVLKQSHPKNPRPAGQGGRDYLIVMDLNNRRAAADLLRHGFGRAIEREGLSVEGYHAQSEHIFLHNDGSLELAVEDYVWMRDLKGAGKAAEDVCISFAFNIKELGGEYYQCAQDLQQDLIGPLAEAPRAEPQTVRIEDGTRRTGATAFERDHCSHPVGGTTRAIPVSISIEKQQGGMHAPTAGNRYDHTKSLKEQDEGLFVWSDEYSTQLSGELGAEGLHMFGPEHLAQILKERADLMNVPRVGSSKNPGFTQQQTNAAAPSARSEFRIPEDSSESESDADDDEHRKVERLAKRIKDTIKTIKALGGFGGIHIDENDLMAGLSLLLVLSRLYNGIHPGIMALVCLGIHRRLIPFLVFFMCGLHPHAGTVPTFDDSMAVEIPQDNVWLLNIMYMSRYLTGGEGPTALAALSSDKLLKLSREFRDPNLSRENMFKLPGHNTYVRDGLSIITHNSFGNWFVHENLQLVVGQTHQAPKGLKLVVDKSQFLGSFHWVDEDGNSQTATDWLLGPGNGPGGELYPRPPDVPEDAPTPAYGNFPREAAIKRWEAHEKMHLPTIDVAQIAEGISSSNGPLNQMAFFARLAGSAKRGLDPLDVPGTTKPATTNASIDPDRDYIPVQHHVTTVDILLKSMFGLRQLRKTHVEASKTVEKVLKLKTLNIDVASLVQKLQGALTELASSPIGPGSPQAITTMLTVSTKLQEHADMSEVLLKLERQRIMVSVTLAYRWLDELVTPQIEEYADILNNEDAIEWHKPKSNHWLEAICREVRQKLEGKGSFQLRAGGFMTGVANKEVMVKKVMGSPEAQHAALIDSVRYLLCVWLGFGMPMHSTLRYLAARFVAMLMDHVGPDALLLDPVWRAYTEPDTNILGRARSSAQLQDLEVFHHALMHHPIVQPDSEERKELVEFCKDIQKVCEHEKLLPPPAPREPTPPRPENMLTFLRLALHMVPKAGDAAIFPPEGEDDPLRREFFEHMLSNTDHLFPIRRSAHGYRPMLAEGSSPRRQLAHSGRTVQHQHGAMAGFDISLQKISQYPISDCVLKACYGGHAQKRRIPDLEAHAKTCWTTANEPQAAYWLTGDKDEKPPAPVKPYRPYLEVYEVVTGKVHKFPLCGDLGGHLLTADYVDAGVVEPPDVITMARIACKIDAGAVAGLAGLDYFSEAKPLNYQKQNTFISLYQYLDQELTDDEKLRLNWGPICLEHSLCKYVWFVTDPRFVGLWVETYYSRSLKFTPVLK